MSSSLSQGETKEAPVAEFDENNSYKVYIVLHGQGIRASPDSSDVGYVHTGTSSGERALNFFHVPEKTKVVRMVPPGHVFMSHIDINKKLRDFFQQPLNQWIQTFMHSPSLSVSAKQAAALKDHNSVDPETQTYNRSRAIFNKMLQLFITGDEITNERLETDYTTAEDIAEFGIWIAEPGKDFPGSAEFSANDNSLINAITGGAKEVPLGDIIEMIRTKCGKDKSFEFYVANCSPVSQDMSAKKRLVRKNNGKWSRDGEYGTIPSSINFWRNTLTMYNKRIKLYHNGNKNFKHLKAENWSNRGGKVLKFPDNDTVWGMMDDEERKDNYKLMNGFLHFYPKWIEAARTPAEKEKIRNDMIFYIKCISTPFVEPIRDGSDVEQGISQVTKVNIPIYGYKNKTTRNKKTRRRKTRKVRYKVSERKVYYTLSEELIKKLAAKINLCRRRRNAGDELAIPLYCDLLYHIYGQHRGEETGYKAGMPQRILACEDASAPVSFSFNGGARRKRRRKTRKKRRRKRKTKRKKGGGKVGKTPSDDNIVRAGNFLNDYYKWHDRPIPIEFTRQHRFIALDLDNGKSIQEILTTGNRFETYIKKSKGPDGMPILIMGGKRKTRRRKRKKTRRRKSN